MAVAAVFDLDGTISNPIQGIARSINFALTSFGLEPRPEGEIARLVGPPIDETFRLLTGGGFPISQLVEKYRERYGAVGYSENEIYPGIREALSSLEHAGISLAVCTSKRKDFADKILELFGLGHFFEFVHGGDVGISKTDQLGMLRQGELVDRKTWMIGDRSVDIMAAHTAGLRAAAAMWGFGSEAELVSAGPEQCLYSPADISALPFDLG